MPARAVKNAPGSGWKPRVAASGAAGSSVPTATTPRAARVSGRLGWLRKNGPGSRPPTAASGRPASCNLLAERGMVISAGKMSGSWSSQPNTVSELPAGFRRDIRAWLVVLLDGDARTRSRSPTTLRVHFGILRPFIEHWAATRGHLREITPGDVDTVLERLREQCLWTAPVTVWPAPAWCSR